MESCLVKKTLLLYILAFLWCFLAYAETNTFKSWLPSKNTIMKIDDELKFEEISTILLKQKEMQIKKYSIVKNVSDLSIDSAYVFGFYFMPGKEFIKAGGKISIQIKYGKTIIFKTWRGKLYSNKWQYINIRFDAKSGTQAKIKIAARGNGSFRIAKPLLTKINIPNAGIKLAKQYLKIPFATLLEDKIQDNLNTKTGTIEFWVCPHWKEKNNNHFLKKNIHNLFFWGEDNRYNSISLWEWNKFPNLYFNYAGSNRKKCSSIVYYNGPLTGWKKNSWHHLAVSWQENKNKINISFFVDGMSINQATSVKTEINTLIKRDMFLGIGKYHANIMESQIANSSFALFRISNKVRYTKPFIPSADYKLDQNTMCFFPLLGNDDLEGFIPLKEGKMKKISAKLYKINPKRENNND